MRSRRYHAPPPSPALAELLAKTGELDRILDGRGLLFEPAPAEPAPEPPQAFVIPPPPWSINYVPELDPDYEPASESEPSLDEDREEVDRP